MFTPLNNETDNPYAFLNAIAFFICKELTQLPQKPLWKSKTNVTRGSTLYATMLCEKNHVNECLYKCFMHTWSKF